MLWKVVVALIAALVLLICEIHRGFKIIEKDDHHRH